MKCSECKHLDTHRLAIPKAGFCKKKRQLRSKERSADTCRDKAPVEVAHAAPRA